MAIEWTPDYCLTCDHQCPAGAAYCSQTCRLTDLERASSSSSNSSPKSATSYAAPLTPSYGFYLPPPLNFSNPTSASLSPKRIPTASTPTGSLSYRTTTPRTRTSLPGLHHSSSKASFASTQTQQEPSYLSEHALRELRDYASSFDQVRDWKRRMTVV